MKKLMGKLIVTGTLLANIVVPVLTTQADTTADAMSTSSSTAENRTASTNTDASFTANTGSVAPVDPSDPNKPSTNVGDNAGKTAGGLSLIYAPMTIDFGAHQIDVMNDKSYNAKGEAATITTGMTNLFAADPTGSPTWSMNATKAINQTTVYPGTAKVVLEVADVRGTNAGWTLNVSSAGGTLSSVRGATITLPQGTVSSSGDIMVSSNLSKAPNGTLSMGRTIAVDGGSAPVLGASINSGAGISTDSLDPAAITLNVDANSAAKGNYTGALNWTLSDTAQANN